MPDTGTTDYGTTLNLPSDEAGTAPTDEGDGDFVFFEVLRRLVGLRNDFVTNHKDAATGVHGVGAGNVESTSNKGVAGGYASLDGTGKVPDAQIPATIARDTEVTAAVAALVDAAPGTLDTLNELAAALGDDPNFATTITDLIAARIAASVLDANTILYADVDNTPAALAVAASRIVGRKSSGGIAALTAAELATILADTMLPWRHELYPLFSTANTNWSTVSTQTSHLFGGYIQSSGAQNAEVSWDVVLGAGTWDFLLLHATGSNRGIYSVQVDGVEVGTIDGYAAVSAANTLSTVIGVAIATSGKHTIKLKMATKNALSSSYFGTAQNLAMRRTA